MTSYGTVGACFQISYPFATGGYGVGPLTHANAQVQYYWNNDWVSWGQVWIPGNTNGCMAVSVPTGYYWRMKVDDVNKSDWRWTHLKGESNWAYVRYAQVYPLGFK